MERKVEEKQLPESRGHSLSQWHFSAFFLHSVCGFGLAAAFWVAHPIYSIDLITNPSQTLCLVWMFEAPLVILLYSLHRSDQNQCSYIRAIGRGLLGLPLGAMVNAFGAIVLGAPVGFQYFQGTLNWSLMMSVFTFVPAASVFGSSLTDWHRIFANITPIQFVDYSICLPAHGAVIGAWFGAWPMPLDWERPWQEWPICVSYGAIAGYFIGMAASCGFTLFHSWGRSVKQD